jgi:chromosome segregation ATPase
MVRETPHPVSTSAVSSSLPTVLSTDAVPALTSTIAAASKLIVPAVSNVISRKSSNTLVSDTLPPSGNDSDLRKQLRGKVKEIEKLNQECLEFEDQVSSLKQEVQEAWDHYKMAQEKAALREAELQDEITHLQKAKQVDKQQSVGQITKLNEDIELILQQMQQLRDEKQLMSTELSQHDDVLQSYQLKINELEEELKEARINSLQGAHHLREEVKQLQIQKEQLTAEHNRLLKQLQSRQSQLEEENAQLSMTAANNQQELLRLRQGFGSGTSTAGSSSNMNEEYLNREILALRQELTTLQAQYNTQSDQKQTLEVQLRQMERDYRVLQLTHDEFRQRSSDSDLKHQQMIQKLESQLQQYQQHQPTSRSSPSGGLNVPSFDVGDDASRYLPSSSATDSHAFREMKQQVEHLSKMLMKKQSDLIDVTAERTTLKSKILDLQAKVSSLETQVSQLRDLEDGDDDFGDDYGGNQGSSSAFQRGQDRLMQRRVARSGAGSGSSGGMMTESMRASNAKVISDLEKFGVKPNASVSRAVTMIDSFALCTGKFLRSNPLIRLAFVMYFILLHLWVFFILVIHTHALELPSDPRDRVQNRLFKPTIASRTVSSMTT